MSGVDGVELRKIEANGIVVQAAVGGEGPGILLLHGWPFNWFIWNRVIPDLVVAGYQVIAPDLRGLGVLPDPRVGTIW